MIITQNTDELGSLLCTIGTKVQLFHDITALVVTRVIAVAASGSGEQCRRLQQRRSNNL